MPRWATQLIAAVRGGGSSGRRMSRPPPSRRADKAASEDGKWQCLRSDCASARGRRLNFADRQTCYSCARPKNEALSPPSYAVVAWEAHKREQAAKAGTGQQQKQQHQQGQQHQQHRRQQRQQQQQQPPPQSAPAASESASPPAPHAAASPSPETRRSQNAHLSEEVLAELSKIMPALHEVLNLLGQDQIPDTETQLPSAESVFARTVAELQPCANVSKVTQLTSEIESLQIAARALDEQRDAALLTPLNARISEAQTALDKMLKKQPSAAGLSSAYSEALAHYQTTIEERRQRARVGMAKTAERQAARRNCLQELLAQLQRAAAAVTQKDEEITAAHAARRARSEALDAQVLALFEAEIAKQTASAEHQRTQQQQAQQHQAQQQQHQLSLSAPAPPPTHSDSADVSMTTAGGDEMEALRRVNAQVQEKLEQAQAALLEAQRAAEVDRAFNLSLDVDDMAPTMPLLENESEARAAEQLFALLQLWAKSGGAIPFCVNTLMACEGSSVHLPTMMQRAMGDAWKHWVQAGGGSNESTIPRQLVWLAHASLQRLHANAVLLAETQRAAASSYAVLTEEHKKRKASS